jgi:hypothetical protein
MYRVKGLRNPVLPSDLVKISGAEEAPEEIVEEQRRLYNPENESAEDPADDVEEIRAPEGFGDMYEDALRELFLVYCELDGFNEIDDEIEAEGVRRLHVLSAHVALRAAGEAMGYPELAQLIRRLGHPDQVRAQQQELFRRMVFNILIDNTDDHEKNHALVRGADGFYALSPAFDLLPSAQGLGYQQMRVGALGHESSMDNALSQARAFGLTDAQAQLTVAEIVSQVDQWKVVFQGLNVRDADIDLLAQYLDGAHLREQRLSLKR